MKTFRLVFIILIMSGLIFQGRAHVCWDDLEFKQFSTPEGLPNSMVHQVYQDRDGYIWIPTFYGLFRYDGYEVRTYKSNLYTPGLLMCFVWKKIILTGFGLGLTRDSVCLINGQGR